MPWRRGFDLGSTFRWGCTRPPCNSAACHLRFLSPDGKWFVLGTGDPQAARGVGEAQIWSAATLQPVSPVLAHTGAVVHAAFTGDSQFLITACSDSGPESKAARLWRVPAGEDTAVEFRHSDGVLRVAVSPDGRRLVTAGEDGTARIWELATGRPVGRPLQHRRGVVSAEFSPDGRRIVTASNDWTARVWDAATGDPLGPPLSHDGTLRSAEFSPDGERVLTSSSDHTVRVWDVSASDQSLASLTRLSELLSGRHVDTNGELAAVNRAFLPLLYQQMRSSEPALFQVSEPARQNWHRQKAAECERNHAWKPLLFHLQLLQQTSPDDEPLRFRRLRARVEWSRDHPRALPMARPDEIARFYPARDPQTAPELLDLSSVYNAPLLENWIYDSPDPASLPWKAGVDQYGGIPFDVRGVLQLATHYDVRQSYSFPRTSPPIPLGQRVRTLHFLHGTGSPTESTWTAIYTVHYSDGLTAEIPVRYGRDVTALFDSRPLPTRPAGPEPAWSGFMAGPDGRLRPANLYRLTWNNPRPEAAIEYIRFSVKMECLSCLESWWSISRPDSASVTRASRSISTATLARSSASCSSERATVAAHRSTSSRSDPAICRTMVASCPWRVRDRQWLHWRSRRHLEAAPTASTYALRNKLRSSPGLVVLTMGGGLVVTSIVSWKLLNVGDGSYRPTIFVPAVVVVDLLGSVAAVMSILTP